MKIMLLFILIGILFVRPVLAQNGLESIKGNVVDSIGRPIENVSVILTGIKKKLSYTNVLGFYTFQMLDTGTYTLRFTSLAYLPVSFSFHINKGTRFAFPIIVLKERITNLNEVSIKGQQVNSDTMRYIFDPKKSKNDETVLNLLDKIQGLSIDNYGNMRMNGYNISKIQIGGKDLFNGNKSEFLNNIPADLIKEIDLVNDYGDIGNISGNKSGGSEKTLNIILKKEGINKFFGNTQLGIGNSGKYNELVSLNEFNEKQQLSLNFNRNNTNNNTTYEHFGAGSFPVLQAGLSGVNTITSLDLNYRRDIGKFWAVYLNISDNSTNNTTETFLNTESFYPGFTALSIEREIMKADNKKAQSIFYINYKSIQDYIKFSGSFNCINDLNNSSSNSINSSSGVFLSTLSNGSSIQDKRNEIDLNLLYNHQFIKAGRNLSLLLGKIISNPLQIQNIENKEDSLLKIILNQELLIRNKVSEVSNIITAQYEEPLGGGNEITLIYTQKYNHTSGVIGTTLPGTVINIDSLSGNYDDRFNKGIISVDYKKAGANYSLYVGLDVLNNNLTGSSNKADTSIIFHSLNIAPSLNYSLRTSDKNTFLINYKVDMQPPVFFQLAPIRDLSNPLNIVIGNPLLKPELLHVIRFSYNYLNPLTNRSFLLNIGLNLIDNKIVDNRLAQANNPIQESSYINVNGYKSLDVFYAYVSPLSSKNFLLTVSGNGEFSNNYSLVNSVKDMGKSMVLNQFALFTYDYPERLKLAAGLNYMLNYNSFSSPYSINLQHDLSLVFLGKAYIHKDYILWSRFTKDFYGGSFNSGNLNPTIINLSVERLFSNRKIGLKLGAYDLLNQSVIIKRNVLANQIIDNKSNSIGRYLLISLIYRFEYLKKERS